MSDAVIPPTIPEPRGRLAVWFDAAGDWFNPILVKEVRQSLKSRQFVLTFLLLLIGAWLVSFLSIMWGDELEFGSMGREIFWWYYLVLSLSMFVIVPITAFHSLLTERHDNTYDLLSITTLEPRQIVRGKLLSAMVQLFIFYAAVTPFVAFTSMLKGFSWPEVLYALGLSMLVSVLACIAALMLSTLPRTRTWQTLMLMAVGVSLFVLFLAFTFIPFDRNRPGFVGMIVYETNMPFDYAGFWWVNGIVLAIGLSYALLFNQIAITRLTFESDNRSTRIRLICLGQFVLAWLCVTSSWWSAWLGRIGEQWALSMAPWYRDWMTWTLGVLTLLAVATLFAPPLRERRRFLAAAVLGPLSVVWMVLLLSWGAAPLLAVSGGGPGLFVGDLSFFVGITIIHFGVVGLFCSTESLGMSRRLSRDLPNSTSLRLLVAPFLPGGGRGYAYLLICLAGVWGTVAACIVTLGGESFGQVVASAFDHNNIAGDGSLVQFTTAGCCYVAIYGGLGLLLTRLLLPLSSELKPGHVRIVTVLVALLAIIVPYLARSFSTRVLQGYSLWLLTVPFDTLAHVEQGRTLANAATSLLMVVASLVVVANLPTMVRGFNEVAEVNPARLRRIDESRHEAEAAAEPPVAV